MNAGLDAGSRLAWAAGRFWALALGMVGLFMLLSVLGPEPTAPFDGLYEAEALIGAAALEIRPEQLPRTASIIFQGGPIAQAVSQAVDVGVTPEDLIADGRIELTPVEDTVLLQLVGRDPDPGVAAALADAAATATLNQLNALGPGFGSFVFIAPAHTTNAPVPSANQLSRLLLSAFAGLVFSAALIGLVVAMRRPVLNGGEASQLAGAPLIGSLRLPRRGPGPNPEAVLGLAAMIKTVLPGRLGIAAFTSVRGATSQRSMVARLFAGGLARSGPVSLVISPDGSPPGRPIPNVAVSNEVRGISRLDDIPIVLDGPSAAMIDIPQFMPADARVVLVIHEGASAGAVNDAASQFLDGELVGVVYVAFGGWRPEMSSEPSDVSSA